MILQAAIATGAIAAGIGSNVKASYGPSGSTPVLNRRNG